MDVAEIGFKADTSGLDKGIVSLNKFKAAAKGTTPAAQAIGQAMTESSKIFAGAVAGMTRGIYSLVKAIPGASAEMIKSAKYAKDFSNELYATSKAQAVVASTISSTTMALNKQSTAVKKVAADLSVMNRINSITGVTGRPQRYKESDLLPGPANDQMPNRFNTANIAAQFQDVGVTAAMGMNPLTIALQQGTQLSAIINSMKNPLQGIAQAFTSIINPVSLLSIGLVGLVAAGIQMVNWTSVAKTMLNTLANTIDFVTPYVLLLGATLSIAFAPAIISGIYSVISAIITMGNTAIIAGSKMAAAWIAANPSTAFVLGFSLILVALHTFKNEMAQVLGFDIFEYAKKGINAITGVFIGTYTGLLAVWNDLPREFGNIAKRAAAEIDQALNKQINKVLDMMGSNFEKFKFDIEPLEGVGGQAGNAFAKGFNEGFNTDVVGVTTGVIEKTFSAGAESLRKMALNLGVKEPDSISGIKNEVEKDPYGDLIKSTQRRIKSLEVERKALSLSTKESLLLKNQTDLLNQAQEKNIELTLEQTSELMNMASTMTEIQTQIDITTQAQELLRDTFKGFFSDLKTGVEEGKSLWESFGNAVTNVLDDILDKIYDISIDNVSNSLFSSMNTNGGLLGSITSWLLPSAKGNAFTSNGVEQFANGGTFTNSIVSDPTLFKFANGSSFGVMGEAGPEAVMPLSRSSDGSLGVQVTGGVETSQPIINITNNVSNAQVSANTGPDGKSIEVMIDEAVSKNIRTPGSNSYNAIRRFNSAPLSKG